MPEHVHVLIWPRHKTYDISKVLASIKLPVTRRAAAFVKRNAPDFARHMTHTKPDGSTELRFWQRGGGYDRNLVEPRAVHATVDYIHANPVRRGVCEKPADWTWSSAAAYAGEEPPIPLDLESLPSVGPTD